MHPAAERVRQTLKDAGLDVEVQELADSTRTAVDAARAVRAEVGQIVKSLVFVAGDDPILLLVSGSNRVDDAFVAEQLECPIRQARADEVRTATGFAIGGVSPVALAQPLPVYADPHLLTYPVVWAAAGTPRSVFAIAPADLLKVTRATPLPVTR